MATGLLSRRWLVLLVLFVLATAWLASSSGQFVQMASALGHSIARLMLAYAICLALALFVGYLAAKYVSVEMLVIPLVDVLQSVPILAFFPAAIYFFASVSSQFGPELASIFLILTCMFWNLVFSVYESIKTIPRDLVEVSKVYNVRGVRFITSLIFPSAFPRLVSNSIISWANGWFFLVASEVISFGSSSYRLEGIGRYIVDAIARGDAASIAASFIFIIFTLMWFDVLLWRPLKKMATGESYQSIYSDIAQVFRLEKAFEAALAAYAAATGWLVEVCEAMYNDTKKFGSDRGLKEAARLCGRALVLAAYGGLMGVMAYLVYGILPILDLALAANLGLAFAASFARVLVAFALSLALTLVVGIRLGLDPELYRKTGMAIQIMASLPVSAFLPLLASLVFLYTGSLEATAILVLVPGMIWYLFYNIVDSVSKRSRELDELAKILKIDGIAYYRDLLLPSIFPAIITGSITAMGGGWNALILAEYLPVGTTVLTVFGIGSIMNKSVYLDGDVRVLMAALIIMVAFIYILNRFFWRRLYKLAERYKYVSA